MKTTTESPTSDNMESYGCEEDNVKMQNWLQDNFEPWDKIKIYWEKTCSFRRCHVLDPDNSFDDVIELWPRYKKNQRF